MSDRDGWVSPFEAPTFTRVSNYLLDKTMPQLSPGAWKLLCVILRATIGFRDEETMGRLKEDTLSYSQLLARSGFRQPRSISRAQKELVEHGIIRRRASHAKRSGLVAPPFTYELNPDWLLDVDELRTAPPRPLRTTADSTLEQPSAAPDAAATDAACAVDSAALDAAATDADSAETKEYLKETAEERRREIEKPCSSLSQTFIEQWPQIKEELRAQLTAATFAQYFWNARPLRSVNGEIRLGVRNEYEAAWIKARLLRVLLASLRAFLGESLTEDQIEIVTLMAPDQPLVDVPAEAGASL
jgi:hypothetical protein